jgi:hypothetical protein
MLRPSFNAVQGKSITNGSRARERRFQNSKEINKATGIAVAEPGISSQILVSMKGLEYPAKKNG